jgi:hypothetical protein
MDFGMLSSISILQFLFFNFSYTIHEKSPSTHVENGKHAASDKGRHHSEDVRISGFFSF